MRKIISLFPFSFFLLTFLAGCATTPRPTGQQIEKAVTLDGRRYVSLTDLSQSYDLDYSWDPVAKKATLAKDNHEVKVLVDSATILLNDAVYTMQTQAKFYQGAVYLPRSFVFRTLIPLFARERPEARAAVPQQALSIKTIIIDPGHGGKDPGAIGKNGTKEKDVVLDVARRLKSKLNVMGVEVILTRASDEFVTMEERSKIANTYAQKADFFISIHANASRSQRVSGVEVFYISEAIDDDLRAVTAAQEYNLSIKDGYCGKYTPAILWDLIFSENRRNSINLAELACVALSRNLTQKNRGRKPARFYVLKGTNLPAVLIEVGFITNPSEEQKLSSNYYCDKIASSIAEGISQYNRSYLSAKAESF